MFRGVERLDTAVVTLILLTVCTTSTLAVMSCEDARLRCAYRSGCAMALQQYLTICSSVLRGAVGACPEICLHALVALTSTDAGKEFMTCDCAADDHLCIQSKQGVEVCRPSVMMQMNNTRVSCRMATGICNADALCSTALEYYNRFCRSMFHGKKCTHRCRNSIDILRRQEKAAKLNTCICDGAEDYDCKGIHRNMNWLCFGKIQGDNSHTTAIVRSKAYGRGAGDSTLVSRTALTLTWTLLLAVLAR